MCLFPKGEESSTSRLCNPRPPSSLEPDSLPSSKDAGGRLVASRLRGGPQTPRRKRDTERNQPVRRGSVAWSGTRQVTLVGGSDRTFSSDNLIARSSPADLPPKRVGSCGRGEFNIYVSHPFRHRLFSNEAADVPRLMLPNK